MSTNNPSYERGYRIACLVRNTLFGIVLLPMIAIVGGPLWYELGV